MSLNTAHAQGGVLLFNGEFILLYCDGVEMTFEGGDAASFKGAKKGRIYLTTHRMVFINNDKRDMCQSFSFPFFTISNLGLEQPIFGANFIKGTVKAEPNGNWTGNCNFKLKFNKGGAIEYGQAMMEAAKAAQRYAQTGPPPPYSPPNMATAFAATSYMAPTGSAPYGFYVPNNVFPEQPPPNSVFMTDMPPPYPGVIGPQQTAYYDPNNRGYAYAPQQPGGYPQNGYPQQQPYAGYPQANGTAPSAPGFMGPPPPYVPEEKKVN